MIARPPVLENNMQPTSNIRPGRPLLAQGIRAQAARRAKEAVEALASVAGDTTAPADARVKAAEVLLAHATMQKAA